LETHVQDHVWHAKCLGLFIVWVMAAPHSL
jgi:hypothetical protein